VSAKAKKPQHEILIKKDDLTASNIGPAPDELFQLMHLTSCSHAMERWKADWLICPVCNAPTFPVIDETGRTVGFIEHRSRKEITH
jgi:hypothetical protein